MGDGIAAYFGTPTAHEDDPERAARAALRILEVVAEYGRDISAAWGVEEFGVRVGINSGQTAVGRSGRGDQQIVALGDSTNVAARLEAAASPGTIVIGESTARRLAHRFVLESLGELTVKGREQPVGAWRLAAVQTGLRGPAPTPLVGRDGGSECVAERRRGADEGSRTAPPARRRGWHREDAPPQRVEDDRGRERALARGPLPFLRRRLSSTGPSSRCSGAGSASRKERPRSLYGRSCGRSWRRSRAQTRSTSHRGWAASSGFVSTTMPVTHSAATARMRSRRRSSVRTSPGSRALCAQGPVVIAIDDLHWADPSARRVGEGAGRGHGSRAAPDRRGAARRCRHRRIAVPALRARELTRTGSSSCRSGPFRTRLRGSCSAC